MKFQALIASALLFIPSSMFANGSNNSKLSILQLSSQPNPVDYPAALPQLNLKFKVKLSDGCNKWQGNELCQVTSQIKIKDAAGATVAVLSTAIDVPEGQGGATIDINDDVVWNLQAQNDCGQVGDGDYDIELTAEYRRVKRLEQSQQTVKVLGSASESAWLTVDRFAAEACMQPHLGGYIEVLDPASPINGASVLIPPGALTQPTLVWIAPAFNKPPLEPLARQISDLAVDFGPIGLRLEEPATIKLPYNPILAGDDEAAAEVYELDDESDPPVWLPLANSQVDIDNNFVQATITRFSDPAVGTNSDLTFCAVQTQGYQGQLGPLYCWGRNTYGQLGIGPAPTQTIPQLVTAPGVVSWSQVSTSGTTTCAVSGAGQLWCWGSNYYGNIGNGTLGGSYDRPQRIGNESDWLQVSVGRNSACAVKVNGRLYCWGTNLWGSVGVGVGNLRVLAPFQIFTDSQGFDISGGWRQVDNGFGHTCGIRQANNTPALYCWGNDLSGQLGNGSVYTGDQYRPFLLNLDGVSNVSTGTHFSCATTVVGALYCWGQNNAYQLGQSDTIRRDSPTRLGVELDWNQVSAGHNFACATKSRSVSDRGAIQGELYCWGQNHQRQAGQPNPPQWLIQPTQEFSQDATWTEVASGYNATCGRKNDGSVWCFGRLWTSPVPTAGTIVSSRMDLPALNAECDATPVPGYSPVAIEWFGGNAYDDFQDGLIDSTLWQDSGGAIEEVGQLIVDTGDILSGFANAGVRSALNLLDGAFTAETNFHFLPETAGGTHCGGMMIVPIGAGNHMIIGVCNSGLDGFLFLFKGSIFDNQEVIVHLGRNVLAGEPIFLTASYDLVTQQLTASAIVSGRPLNGVLGVTAYDPFAAAGGYTIDVGARASPTIAGEAARAKVSFQNIRLELGARYISSLSPYQIDSTSYDAVPPFGSPHTVFFAGGDPVFINADFTPIPADGITDYNIALITTTSGERLTSITPFDQTTMAGLPGVASVDAFVPSVYMAQGFGANYAIGPCGQ